MIQYNYNINNILQTDIAGIESLSEQDARLINQYQINNLFDKDKHYIELHITDLADNLISQDLTYRYYKFLGDSQSAGRKGASILYIDSVEDLKTYGLEAGDVKLTYHFLNDLFSNSSEKSFFFIQEISTDRLELKLNTTTLSQEDITAFAEQVKQSINNASYLDNYRLNFQDNTLPLFVNLDTFEEDSNTYVIVKLYQPLPEVYSEKAVLNITEIISDSVSYEVNTTVVEEPVTSTFLSPANFNLAITDEQIVPTEYLSYDTLLSFPVNNTNSKLYSSVAEKSVELSIDYSKYSDFINFSSLTERLSNFEYKLRLINQYSSSLQVLDDTQQNTQQVSGSREYYENLIKGILSNFDHYERHLYYTSGSTAWPKVNTVEPYVNKPVTDPEASSWFSYALQEATLYDSSNYNNLVNTIPTYLQEDPNNENYLLFINMIGQHFDNLWIYTEHLTDKYDADNRLSYGISKDLVKDVLTNFGINIYTSKKSVEDLFNSFITQTSSTEREIINYYITGSITGSDTSVSKVSYDDYQKEVYKRIYHNLPLLLKSKGTERGLRALINCFGIPSDVLTIKLYGGLNIDGATVLSDAVYVTSSLDKIRLNNEGVSLPENTLSLLTKTRKPGKDYTDDLHVMEIGFSPTNDVDNFIKTQLTPDFDLDDYLGDPRNLYKNYYQLLDANGNTRISLEHFSQNILDNLGEYNIKDYVRLLKFFDNVIFKMIRDFIPARSTANVGVVIKPHILGRSKVKFTQVDVSFHHYSASIEVGDVLGNHGNTFGARDQYSTLHTKVVQTPEGLGVRNYPIHETAKYDGEFANSQILISSQDLNKSNSFKYDIVRSQFISSSILTTFPTNICNIITGMGATRTITGLSNQPRNLFADFTNLGTSNIIIITGSTDITSQASNYTFPSINYAQYQITASNTSIVGCSGSILYTTQYCDLSLAPNAPSSLVAGEIYDLTTWFTQGTNTDVIFKTGSTVISFPTNYQAPGVIGSTVTISLEDNQVAGCIITNSVTIVDTPFECNYLVRFRINIPYNFGGEFPSEENPYPFEYTYITYNNGLGGQEVTVFDQLTDKVQAFTVNEQIVEGSLHVDVPPNWVVTPVYTSCS